MELQRADVTPQHADVTPQQRLSALRSRADSARLQLRPSIAANAALQPFVHLQILKDDNEF